MADVQKPDADSFGDIQKTLEKQIADLRKDIKKINQNLAERSAELAEEAKDQASELYDTASARATRTTRQLKDQAHVVSDVARENPATATAVIAVVGLVGFLIGLAVGQTTHEAPRRWY